MTPWSLWRERGPAATLMPYVWSPELGEDEMLLFEWQLAPRLSTLVTAARGN